jgi:hypothetical protein
MSKLTPVERWNLGHSGFFWLTRRKAMVIIHHGIVKRDEFGRIVVLELKPTGVRLTDIQGFADGEHVFVRDWKSLSAGIDIEPRAADVLAKRRPFSLVNWNCEHVASSVWNGRPESAQVKGWGVAAVALIGLFFFGR